MTVGPKSDDNAAIVIAYGSNMPSATALPVRQSASQAFGEVVKTLRNRGLIVNKISRLWHSLAWPDPAGPPYVNAVLQVQTTLQPFELMALLHDIEREFGRVRIGVANAPRAVDLDLISYGQMSLGPGIGLTLPHPRAADRAFVMGPLAEILPDWVHPLLQRTAIDLLGAATVGRDAYPLADDAASAGR